MATSSSSSSFHVAGFSYFAKNAQEKKTQQKWRPTEYHELPTDVKKFIEENNLVVSYLSQEYVKRARPEHFFDGAILKDLRGFHYLKVFVEKEIEDVVNQDKIVSQDDKKKLYEKAKLIAVFSPTKSIEKRKGTTHSGALFTLVDNHAGFLALIANDVQLCFTIYLNMEYLKALSTSGDYVIVLEVDKLEGPKVFIKGKIIDLKGNVYVTIDTMFINAKMGRNGFNKMIEERLEKKRSDGRLKEDKEGDRLEISDKKKDVTKSD